MTTALTTGGALTERDRQIIEHVARYRLTTIESLDCLSLGGRSTAATRKAIARLCSAQYLQGYPLIHPTRYYVLGSEGVKALGLSTDRTLPLGPQSLPMAFAVLAYASQGERTRRRLKPVEVLQICSWLSQTMASAPHCLDDGEGVLELLRVDLGGPPDHVARKCVADIHARERLPEFRAFARSGKFRLVVITATSSKSSALRQAIERHDWPIDLPIHFSIVPQLLSLTARKHDA